MGNRINEIGVAGWIEPDLSARVVDIDVDAIHSIGIAGAITARAP